MIVAQQSAEPLVTIDGSTRRPKTTAATVASNFFTIRREDPNNHRGLFDDGDNLQVAATLGAVLEVDIEHALEQTRPAHARRRAVLMVACIIG